MYSVIKIPRGSPSGAFISWSVSSAATGRDFASSGPAAYIAAREKDDTNGYGAVSCGERWVLERWCATNGAPTVARPASLRRRAQPHSFFASLSPVLTSPDILLSLSISSADVMASPFTVTLSTSSAASALLPDPSAPLDITFALINRQRCRLAPERSAGPFLRFPAPGQSASRTFPPISQAPCDRLTPRELQLDSMYDSWSWNFYQVRFSSVFWHFTCSTTLLARLVGRH